jgi:hypothetical protein
MLVLSMRARARRAFWQAKRQREGPTCGCGKRSRAPFPCFRPVLYRERRNSNVSSRQRAAPPISRIQGVALYFSLLFRGAAERRSATSVAGRAFRAPGVVTACRLKESQGQP